MIPSEKAVGRPAALRRSYWSPVDHVNPLQGTDSCFEYSHGNTLPLIGAPFGMNLWTPQTLDQPSWYFNPRIPRIAGLRLTHQFSPWLNDYAHCAVMPQTGPPALTAPARGSVALPRDTVITPYYFRTVLGRYRTVVELAPTERCAILRFTFPSGAPARVIFDWFKASARVAIDPSARLVRARLEYPGAPGRTAFFVARFDRSPRGFGVFGRDSAAVRKLVRRYSGRGLGAYVEFGAASERTVEMRVALSFIGFDQALLSLRHETDGRSLEVVQAATRAAWNQLLGRVRIDGAMPEQRRTFYSCLYRCLLFPMARHEYDAQGQPVHASPYHGGVEKGVMYTGNVFWDTHRALFPLLTLLYPERVGEMLQGFVNAYHEGGWLPQACNPGYTGCMVGSHLGNIFSDAYLKGIRSFDARTAFEGMLKDGDTASDGPGRGRQGLADYLRLGYVPADKHRHAAALTEEYAYNDFGIAQMAWALGDLRAFRRFRQRALNYRQVFDQRVGFMRGRRANGAWVKPFDEFDWSAAFIEGSAWQYSWAVPHDWAGLMRLLGGRKKFAARLDRLLTLPPRFSAGLCGREIHEMTEMAAADFGQYAHSNEPVHHVLYFFTCAGQPWKTQYWIRRVLTELYHSGPAGFCGDEDTGQMSAWYVFNALGIYPMCPGHPSYVFGSPLFPKAVIRWPDRKPLVIAARENSPKHPYVWNLHWNGRPYRKTWISHADLIRGGLIAFDMSSRPNRRRRFSGEELPYALSTDKERKQ